jgi:hypothetical protein
MHTSYQLDSSCFAVKINGKDADCGSLLPEWSPHDRVGIIVDENLGAIGASLLIQFSITAFYDECASRRSKAIYPEIYLFHVGGRYGDHSSYDIYPPRKEIFLDDDPVAILESINTCGISRLIVVDGAIGNVQHHFKEPACAKERITSAFAYSPYGRVRDPDIEIAGLNRRVVANTSMAIKPGKKAYAELMQSFTTSSKAPSIPENEKLPVIASRVEEVSLEQRNKIIQQRLEISVDGLPYETYRRISISDALNMLSSRASRCSQKVRK